MPICILPSVARINISPFSVAMISKITIEYEILVIGSFDRCPVSLRWFSLPMFWNQAMSDNQSLQSDSSCEFANRSHHYEFMQTRSHVVSHWLGSAFLPQLNREKCIFGCLSMYAKCVLASIEIPCCSYFWYCTSLSTLPYGCGWRLTEIEATRFANCCKLALSMIPASHEVLCARCFRDCCCFRLSPSNRILWVCDRREPLLPKCASMSFLIELGVRRTVVCFLWLSPYGLIGGISWRIEINLNPFYGWSVSNRKRLCHLIIQWDVRSRVLWHFSRRLGPAVALHGVVVFRQCYGIFLEMAMNGFIFGLVDDHYVYCSPICRSGKNVQQTKHTFVTLYSNSDTSVAVWSLCRRAYHQALDIWKQFVL
jgi:hypothetical protein